MLMDGMKLVVFVDPVVLTSTELETGAGAWIVDWGDRTDSGDWGWGCAGTCSSTTGSSSNILPTKNVPMLPNISGTPYNIAILHAYLSPLYFIF